MEKNELLKEFENKFEKLKKELKFKATLDELDEVFYLKDLILKEGYISSYLSKQICRRIIEIYSSWANYLHGIIVVNPGSMISITEGQIFNEDEREKISRLIDKIMIFSTDFNLIVLNGNKEKEKKFIDSSFLFWKNECNPELSRILKKINEKWTERSKSKPEKINKELRKIYG